MTKTKNFFASLIGAFVLALTLTAFATEAKATCFVTGDVYKGSLPMAALVEVWDANNNLIGSAWTNGNGFYEIQIPDQSGAITVNAGAKGHYVVERFTSASSVTFSSCATSAVKQVYWEAIPR